MSVSPVNVTGDAGLSPEMKTFYNRELLYLAEKKTVLDQFGQAPVTIPKGSGKTAEWRRFSQFTKLTGAATALTEGVTPTGSSLTVTAITATAGQYGDFYAGSDVVEQTTIDPLLKNVVRQQAYQMARVREDLIQTIVYSGTTVQYANSRASRAAIAAGDVITETELRKVMRTLKNNSVEPLKNGKYAAIIHPYTWYDLMSDANIRQTMQYAGSDRIFNAELGTYLGFTFVESELAPSVTSTTPVYQTLFVGRDFFGKVLLSGLTAESIYKPIGSAGTADALNQRFTQGWKNTFVAKVLDDTKAVRLEHAVSP
jgi:N4-gp56 family major capsid protein